MAISKIKPRHASEGKSIAQILKDRLDYNENPDKTRDGLLVKTYQCNADTAWKEFTISKQIYTSITGRTRKPKEDVISYLLIQSFKPGEITPEDATELGYQLAMEFTEGQHQFIVATHTDRHHIHCHIEFNSTTLDCTHKFNNYKDTYRTIRKISDRLCTEHGLSVISEPKEKGQHYAEWANERRGTSWKAALKNTIDRVLPTVRTFDDFLAVMRREGYEVRQDGKYLKFRAVGAGQERYTRAKTLGADYTEEMLRERVGKPPIRTKRRIGRTADPAKINLIVDIQSRLRGRGPGYERWLKVHNLKEAAKTLTYLTEHGITEYAALEKLAAEQIAKRDAAVTTIRQYEQRMERIADLRTHIVNYAKTRDIYLQYRKLPAAKKAAFASAHEDELMLHRAAKQAFEEYGEKKLPAMKDLQAQYKDLLEKKRVAYAEYRPLKQQAQEMETIKKNVDSLLQIDAAQQEREAEKRRNEQSQAR